VGSALGHPAGEDEFWLLTALACDLNVVPGETWNIATKSLQRGLFGRKSRSE
jgi:hypothetical protein